MIECEVTAKKWGNSLGIILPKDLLEKGGIKENDTLQILVGKKDQTAKKIFGMFKGKMNVNAQELKDNMRREFYND